MSICLTRFREMVTAHVSNVYSSSVFALKFDNKN